MHGNGLIMTSGGRFFGFDEDLRLSLCACIYLFTHGADLTWTIV